MERNAVEEQVAQYYAGGIYAADRAQADTAIEDDRLFMYLMGEAGQCEDVEAWIERIADAVDRIQDLMEVLDPGLRE